MKNAIGFLIIASTIGLLGYLAVQWFVPGSKRSEDQFWATIDRINIKPAAADEEGEGESGESENAETVSPASSQAVLDNRTAVARNAYLVQAIALLEDERDKLDTCVRAKYLLDLAEQESEKNGISEEAFLLELAQSMSTQLYETTLQRGGFRGTADSVDEGRDRVQDSISVLYALSHLYNHQSPECWSEPLEASAQLERFVKQAQEHRMIVQRSTRQQFEVDGEVANYGE